MSGSRTRKFSGPEKEQLLANLDLEVAHKMRQFEDWLMDSLENFKRHQESLILRMPRIVRNVTMREFAKYEGDIQAAVKGLSRELLGSEDATIDLGTRKRKWVESQGVEEKAAKANEAESSRATKTARTITATPKKKKAPTTALIPPGTANKSRLPITKTPAKARTLTRVPSGAVSPSPQKGLNKPLGFPRTPSRFASPVKSQQPLTGGRAGVRVPSSSTFNPSLPAEASQARWPRQNEHMLSANGSPLANPYQLGFNNWFKAVINGEPSADSDGKPLLTAAAKGLKKQRSILVRSASTSSQLASSSQSSGHSRAPSQASTLVASQSDSQSQRPGSVASDRTTLDDPFIEPAAFAALVSVQTSDGHVLEFNPLRTSPEELDALEGISESAKKQAKEDMARVLQLAMSRWKIG